MRRVLPIVLLTLVIPLGLAAQSSDPITPAPAPGTGPAPAPAFEVEPPMTYARMGAILRVLDPDAVIENRGATLTVASVPVTIVVDEGNDRMRIMVPISSAEGLGEAELTRLMQANFDTALDARYAIANNRLWSTFIHPLSPLETDQLVSAIAQTVTLARTYGDTYTSGAIMFGSGDTGALIEELQNLGEEL